MSERISLAELDVHDELLAAWEAADRANDVPFRTCEDVQRTRDEFWRTGEAYESWLVANGAALVAEIRRLSARVRALESALRPFVGIWTKGTHDPSDPADCLRLLADCQRAADLLGEASHG